MVQRLQKGSTARNFVFGLAASLIFGGCSFQLQKQKVSKVLRNDYCAIAINTSIAPSPQTIDLFEKKYPKLSANLGNNNLRVSKTVGILDQLVLLSEGIGNGITISKVDELEIREGIGKKILLAQNLIHGTAEELDCEVSRTARIRDYLAALGSKRNNTLTIGAIFSGTATGLAPLIISNQKPQNIAVIAGSALSAALGIAVLTNNKKKVGFYHQRNLLGDIWNYPKDARYFPEYLWRILTMETSGGSDSSRTVAGEVRKRWALLELLGVDDHESKLLFGTGGNYTQDELSLRISLLQQLSSEIRLQNIKLTQLSNAIDNLPKNARL